MASQGKGISDAVRGAIGEWMTESTVNLLWDRVDKKDGKVLGWNQRYFGNRLRDSDMWVRITRSRGRTGWRRTYYTKAFPSRDVTLEVNSNEADTHIEYVTVKANGKIIGGGKVKVPSVLISQDGRKAGLKLELTFVPFSSEELARIQAEMEYGDSAVHALLFEDRMV
jgi:hypothetical protein